jgi:PAS domain S-box-containing protein
MLRVFLVLFCLAGGVGSLILAHRAWQRRASPGARLFAWLMFATGIYAFGYSLELSSNHESTMMASVYLEYLGIAFLPTLWLSLALRYSHSPGQAVSPRTALLFIIPGVILLSLYTNPWLHLFYADVWVDRSGPFPTLAISRGPLYWLHIANVAACYLAATVSLLRAHRSPHALFRRQVTVMLLASLLTILVWVLYLFHIFPIPYLDITVFAGILAAAVMGFGMSRYHLVSIVPIAREHVLESTTAGIIVVDPFERIVDINPAGRAILQALNAPMERDVIGQTLEELLIHASDDARKLVKLHKGRIQVQMGSETRAYDLNISPLHGYRQEIGQVIVLHDITVQHQIEQQLQQNELRFRMLAENSTDVIWMIDLNGRFTYVSPAVYQLRGYLPEEVLAQPVADSICPGSLERVNRNIERALQMAGRGDQIDPEYVEVEQPCKDGSTVWTEVTARLINDEHGRPVGFVGISRDINQRKRMQANLQASLDELTLFNRAMTGREMRMIELKMEVNHLLAQLGQPPRYEIPEE